MCLLLVNKLIKQKSWFWLIVESATRRGERISTLLCSVLLNLNIPGYFWNYIYIYIYIYIYYVCLFLAKKIYICLCFAMVNYVVFNLLIKYLPVAYVLFIRIYTFYVINFVVHLSE